MNHKEKQQRYIEKVGVLSDSIKVPKMAGRIFGWLLICDPPYQSAEQLAQAVGGSKASISTMTRYLIHFGLLERVGIKGQRKSYFQIPSMAWVEHSRLHMKQFYDFRKIAIEGLEILEGAPPSVRRRLEDLRLTHEFVIKELPEFMDKLRAYIELNMKKLEKEKNRSR